MLRLVLLISITSQLLVVEGFLVPPADILDQYPEYRDEMILFGTKNELEEAKSIIRDFSL